MQEVISQRNQNIEMQICSLNDELIYIVKRQLLYEYLPCEVKNKFQKNENLNTLMELNKKHKT